MLKHLRALCAAALFALACAPALAATLLPQGESCFQAVSGVSGMVGALGTITGGSGGVPGVYGGAALTGGSGTGATANITVNSSGAVSAVIVLNPGSAYVVGDVLSATVGGVSGFSVPVNSTSINSSLAGGTVAFYIPNTQAFKQTWQNSGQTILNTNPVQLDQNGCQIIYGEGIYRQILKDSLGNTVWDQLTASTDQGGFFWAGLASGTPNAILVNDPNFSGIDGQAIQFRAFATNTTAATINPSSYGLIPVVKDTAAGPVALSGSEIAIGAGGQNNVVSVVFDKTNDEFHLIAFPQANAVVNEIVPYQGGFKNLTITNGATPSIIISIAADQLVLQNAAGLTAKISAVGCAINISTNAFTANSGGMDSVASESPISQWISVWGIYNPTTQTQSCLGSLSPTAPILPSGYTFAARFGWMLTDGSANLLRTLQNGRRAHYVVVVASNTASLPQLASGSTSGAWTAKSVSAFVPPTASEVVLSIQLSGNVSAVVSVAPNAGYTGITVNSLPVPLTIISGSVGGNPLAQIVPVELESSSIYYFSGSASGAAYAYAWEDNL